MKRVLFICAVVAMAVPVWAATDYFPVTVNGSFDTYPTEGYINQDGNRLGKTNQDIGWMTWDGKNSSGTEQVSKGDNSGQTMSAFVAAGGGIQSATLYLSLGNPLGSGVGDAIETIRCGNTGVLQADAGGAATNGYTGPANNITGASEPYAFASGAPDNGTAFSQQGILNSGYVPWITPSNSAVSAYGWAWTSGINTPNAPIVKTIFASTYGYDSTRSDVGGWALQYLLGYANNQGGTTMARANAAGQIMNNDGAGNIVPLGLSDAVVSSPRAGTNQGANWYAITLSADLANAIVNDPQCKGIAFQNYVAGLGADYSNDGFGDASNSSLGAYLVIITPEPATMVLLALGGLALIRRRR